MNAQKPQLAVSDVDLAQPDESDILRLIAKFALDAETSQGAELQARLYQQALLLALELIGRLSRTEAQLRQQLRDQSRTPGPAPNPRPPPGGSFRRAPEFSPRPQNLTHNPFAEAFRSKSPAK